MPHHRVVLVVTVVRATVVTGGLAEREAGEEDDRHDEHDPGDDGHPCRTQEDPGGPADLFDGGWRWCCCGCCPHGWGFRSFTHETDDAWVNSSGGYALLK
jgi:hypothetical protein